MSCFSVRLGLALLLFQIPSVLGSAVPEAAAQGAVPDSTVVGAIKVLDSLIPVPPPKSLTRAQAGTWQEHTAWLKDLKARMENLLAMVVAPAKTVAPPAPIAPKNIAALQEEAEVESRKFVLTSSLLKARHEIAMNAIRNMK